MYFDSQWVLTHTEILQIGALRKRLVTSVSEKYLSMDEELFVKKYLAVSWILKKQNFKSLEY